MDADPIANPEFNGCGPSAPPLLHVLRHCETLQSLVDALSKVQVAANMDLLQKIAAGDLADLREHCVGVARRDQVSMGEVSKSVSTILRALRREIRYRDLVDHQLAAAVEQQEASHHAALHDALTGIPNRALFFDRLDHGLGQARRHSWDLALMFIDLDNFKRINDDHGHTVGDAVLRTIAGRLRDSTRVADTVSRHGGDEFTYLALDVRDIASVSVVADKLIEVIGKPCGADVHGLDLRLQVRASIGISIFPANGEDAEELIRSADRAMYQAKKSGVGYAFAA